MASNPQYPSKTPTPTSTRISQAPFDVAAILASSRKAARPKFGTGFQLEADKVLGVVAGVDEVDVLAVNALFWQRRFDTNRRIWEVYLNRLRRFGSSLQVQEEGIVVIAVITKPEHVFSLRKQMSIKTGVKLKKRSRSWQILLQYPYRFDSDEIVGALTPIPGFRRSSSKATGCWGFINAPTEETWTEVFGRIVEALSCWFDTVLVATDQGLVR